jgi:hypothetical protein
MPGVGKDVERSLKKSRRKLLQLELILQSFRHDEFSGESGPDEIVERLVNVRARIGRHRNLPQRDQSVGHDRNGENKK